MLIRKILEEVQCFGFQTKTNQFKSKTAMKTLFLNSRLNPASVLWLEQHTLTLIYMDVWSTDAGAKDVSLNEFK